MIVSTARVKPRWSVSIVLVFLIRPPPTTSAHPPTTDRLTDNLDDRASSDVDGARARTCERSTAKRIYAGAFRAASHAIASSPGSRAASTLRATRFRVCMSRNRIAPEPPPRDFAVAGFVCGSAPLFSSTPSPRCARRAVLRLLPARRWEMVSDASTTSLKTRRFQN